MDRKYYDLTIIRDHYYKLTVIRDSKGLYRNHKMLRESSYNAKTFWRALSIIYGVILTLIVLLVV